MGKRFFLEEVVDYTFKKYKDFRKLSIVFPNRRAGLYFQKALSKQNNNILWSPKVQTIEDFVQEHVDIKISDDITDQIKLNYSLFNILEKYQSKEYRVSFDEFYYWGQILIKDFDDVDLSLKNKDKIFKLIKNQKEIEESFNFLEKENYEKIRSFWDKFFPKMSINQKNFNSTWKILLDVYNDYKKILIKNKLSYKGLVFKEFLKKIDSGIIDESRDYLFVGFSYLSNSEKKIIQYFINNQGSMAFWDYDKYYFNDFKQEAGDSFRDFSKDKILASTFPDIVPNNFISSNKKFDCIGIGSQIGQCKTLGNLLSKNIISKNFDQDKVLVLLPDEKLLLPVLNSIPEKINKINVTMGLNLSETPLFDLLQLITKIHKNLSIKNLKKSYYFEDIINLISHPYIYQFDSVAFDDFIFRIRKNKLIYIDHDSLNSISDIFKNIFIKDSIVDSLKNICQSLFECSEEMGKLDREYIKAFLKIINKVHEIQIKLNSLDSQYKLLNQILKTTRIPFSGEPLSGLQIMGVLESRNLDFDQVYILSMNEGDFPKSLFNISFIPYNIRRAFELETKDSMDKVYSYLFYRVIQRAKNITFIYNTNSSISSKGERSRYIKQLESESKFNINNYMISDKLEIIQKPKMSINKTEETIELLKNRFFHKGYISPSGIKDYMDCSLRFYYKYISNIRESNEITSEILKPDFGKITHKALEVLYSDVIKNSNNRKININDFFVIKNSISGAIQKVIKSHFKLNKKNQLSLEGNNIILNEIMEDYILRIISLDEKYAPFEIFALEGDKKSGYTKTLELSKNLSVNISGIIDRIDLKNNIYRIIDYKTGGDSKRVKNLENLFSSERKDRNDAVFQLFFYSLLLKNKIKDDNPIIPGLMNIREINNENFTINISVDNDKINDVNDYLNEFENLLSKKLSEIFDKNLQFIETDDKEACKFCAYKNLCSN